MKKIVLLMFVLFSVNIWANLVEDGIAASKKGDNTQAFEMFKKSCDDEKNAVGCKYTAEAYNKGIVVRSSINNALLYYTKSCKFGLASSCLFIANSYHRGTGVKKDNVKALKFFDYACKDNIGEACQNYGFMCEMGQGIKRDPAKAKKYYRKSCELGEDKGCTYAKQLEEMGIR